MVDREIFAIFIIELSMLDFNYRRPLCRLGVSVNNLNIWKNACEKLLEGCPFVWYLNLGKEIKMSQDRLSQQTVSRQS